MENYLGIILPAFLTISIGFSLLINWLLLRFSRNLGMRNLNKNEEIRWSSTRKPALGGISFFISFLLAFSMAGVMQPSFIGPFNLKLIGVAASCSLAFLLGLADDAYNTNPLVKFMGQLTCAFILISSGIYIPVTGLDSVDFIVTTIWVIGMMNSINMLDNMDGITTSISGLIVIGVLSIVFIKGAPTDITGLLMMVGVLGGLIGFLFFNWNPSKMYMGDTGSMFLGVFLASISMMSIWGERNPEGGVLQIKQFVIPMLIFMVPLIDTTTVTIRRLMRRQSPFVGGRDHITHHLAYNGLKDWQVALLLIAIAVVSDFIALLPYFGWIEWNLVYTIVCIAYALVLFTVIQIVYNRGTFKKAVKDIREGKERKSNRQIGKVRKISG